MLLVIKGVRQREIYFRGSVSTYEHYYSLSVFGSFNFLASKVTNDVLPNRFHKTVF